MEFFLRTVSAKLNNYYLLFTTDIYWASQVMLVVKNPPTSAADRRDAAGVIPGEEPVEEGMATHSSTLAWRFPWTEVPGGLQSMGLHRLRRD